MATPARAVIESLSQRYNLESHLTRQGLVLHQRGKAPANRLVQAGRVQWALSEARDRRAGRRPDEPDAELARGMAVALSFEKARLRQVAETIHDRTGIPVYLDSTLWIVNPTVSLEPVQSGLVGDESALAVLERDDDLLACLVGARPRRVDILDTKHLIAADERPVVIADECAGQEMRFTQDLEAVADPQHRKAAVGSGDDLGHHRSEARDGSATQVVAVGESTGKDDRVDSLQVVVAVPERDRIAAGPELLDTIAPAVGVLLRSRSGGARSPERMA